MKLYTVRELSELAGIAQNDVWRDVRKCGIEPKQIGRKNCLTEAQKDAYLEARKMREIKKTKEGYCSSTEAAEFLGVSKNSLHCLKGIERVKSIIEQAGRRRFRLYCIEDLENLKKWRESSGQRERRATRQTQSAVNSPSNTRKTPVTITDTGKGYYVAQTAHNAPPAWNWAQSVGM